MSEEKKFNSEELGKIKDLQTKYQTITAKMGQLEVDRVLLDKAMERLDDNKNKLTEEYINVQAEEKKSPKIIVDEEQDTNTINSEAVANASPSQQVKEWEQLVKESAKQSADPLPIPVSLHNGMANNETVQAILGDMYEHRLDWSEFVKNWPKISSAMMQLKEDYQDLLIAYKDEIKAYHKGNKGML